MITLQGRRALVCGSTQGIGRASAEGLAAAGAEVVLLARNAQELEAVRETLPIGDGVQHETMVADFADPATVRSVVGEYLASHPPIHYPAALVRGATAAARDFLAAISSPQAQPIWAAAGFEPAG